MVDEEVCPARQMWDINPELDFRQHQALNILIKYAEVFARDPKKPKVTHLTEHVIETGRSC